MAIDWQPILVQTLTTIIAPAAILLITAWIASKKVMASTNQKLDQIHTLVNSNMTAAMQDSLDSTIRERAALIELSTSRKDANKEPTQDTVSAIALADAKISELRVTLEYRRTQK